jgi:hypothetical protein
MAKKKAAKAMKKAAKAKKQGKDIPDAELHNSVCGACLYTLSFI